MNLDDLTRFYDFSGRTIVITGGTGVLGREITRTLLDCGANVAIVARDEDRARPRVEYAKTAPGRALVVIGDVLVREQLQAAANKIRLIFSRVDGLVNGAGGNDPRATTGPEQSFFDLPPDVLRFVGDLNLLGTILPSQVFGRFLAEQGQGVILNLASMSAFRPLTKVPAYSAAKAAVGNFTQWLAVHMAREHSPNIRVNAIAPGFFLTEQNRFLLTDRDTGALTPRGQAILDHTPMARFGQPQDLLGTVLWLLSPASAFVTGVVVPIDGGFSAFSGV
jgi:NAD(P)-dependent dehydrogenase (short-subunit alcohol dehydrogenase family)